jgi:hypothetical protein
MQSLSFIRNNYNSRGSACLRQRLRERRQVGKDTRVELRDECTTGNRVCDGVHRARRGRRLDNDVLAPEERADCKSNRREDHDRHRLAVGSRVLDLLEDREDKDGDDDEPEENAVIEVGHFFV